MRHVITVREVEQMETFPAGPEPAGVVYRRFHDADVGESVESQWPLISNCRKSLAENDLRA
jgi:hypothetical protein